MDAVIEETLAEDAAKAEVATPQEMPFHVYSKRVKWYLVVIIGMAGLFSGLSSNIYLPSLSAISQVRAQSSSKDGLQLYSLANSFIRI